VSYFIYYSGIRQEHHEKPESGKSRSQARFEPEYYSRALALHHLMGLHYLISLTISGDWSKNCEVPHGDIISSIYLVLNSS
jgi:hypothetical protein